jgi:hypothetical protein
MKIKTIYALFLSVILFLVSSAEVNAQDEAYDDLLFLVIDGKYEKALSKAERYMNKKSSKRHPEPYIYASMAYNEISQDEKLSEDYPRAFRDAIKNGYKAARYDREGTYLEEHKMYFDELIASIMTEARYYYETENWRRAATYAKYALRIDEDDLSALMLKSVAEFNGRNKYQAEKTMSEAEEALGNFDPDDVELSAQEHYLYALIEYANLMKKQEMKSEAEAFISAMAPVFADEPQFEKFYETY